MDYSYNVFIYILKLENFGCVDFQTDGEKWEYKNIYIFICVPKMNISLIGLQCYVAAEGQHIVVNAGSFFIILILLFSASQICPGDPTALFEVPGQILEALL